MDFKSTAISGVKWTTVDKVGKAVFQLLQVAILTRFLPKEAFGLVAMAVVVIGFTNIFVDMGLTSAILHKQDATVNEYSSIYWLNIFISVGLYIFLLIATPFVSDFYSEKELLTIVPILGTNILLIALGRQHRTIMQKEFRFKPIALVELSAYFVGVVVAVLFAYRGAGVYSLVYSTLTASAITNILFLGINIRLNPIKLHFHYKDTIPFLRVGGYQMGSKILDFASKEVDIFIVGKMLGAEALGLYSLSKQIVLKLFSLINPIVVNVLSPLLSSIQKESEKLKRTFLRVVKYLAYINFPLYFLILINSREILHIVYGSEYEEGFVVLSLLAIYYCIISLSNPVGSLQIATGRTDIGFLWTILRVILTPVFIFIGSLYSINGVALSVAVLGVILLVPLWYVQLRPMADISLREYLEQFYKPLSVFFIFGLIAIAVDYFINMGPIFVSLLIKSLFFMILFAGGLYMMDRKSLKSFWEFSKSSLKKSI
ncbi:MOP flippase family protein [Fodinibius sp. SL11]|uniref:MOP flippase family protein n=1 Tax=Fodinibius sp. SL11 TaxID=3425690 RepID=UPI003F882859